MTITEPTMNDSNADRAWVYRGLARLFQPPDEERIQTLRTCELPELCDALDRLASDADLIASAENLLELIRACDAEELGRSYDLTFEAPGGLRCPANETSVVADTASEQMTRTYALADVAGFYRAFGVEVTAGSEQPDHIAAELEFMHLLAVKEALARLESRAGENADICREAARAFLRDHLGRWAQRLSERLEENAADPVYATAGRLLGRFVALDAEELGAEPELDRAAATLST